MKVMRSFSQKTWVMALFAAIVATMAAEAMYRTGAAQRVEYLYSDLWHRLAGKRFEPQHAALVMIDDPSLNERPDEPLAFWTPHFAKALSTLREAGVKLVAIDFLFSGSPERWIEKLELMSREKSRNYDQPFREQINRGQVLLAGFQVGAGKSVDDFILPSPDYLLALPDMDIARSIGLANINSDTDGAVRRFRLREVDNDFAAKEGLPTLTFGALAALTATGQNLSQRSWIFGGREIAGDQLTPITFPGPPGSFRAVSFAKLLKPDALSDPEVKALAGKVVVIGAGYAGMNDAHPTPYSSSLASANQLMPGPEIQTGIIETLLSGRFTDEASPFWRLAGFTAVLVLVALAGARLSAWQGIVVVVAGMGVASVVTYQMFLQAWLFPLAHLQFGMVVVIVVQALLRLTKEERERERIGQMFGRYVSPNVISALLASPSLPELGGQARNVTVLFSDIRGFTTLSEKLTAREVVEMLNTYFERACGVLMAEGATIDKFIGDAIMAEFGAPLDQPDHARRAIRAAIALHQVAVDFRSWMAQRFGDRDLHEFDIGIGLHSGEAVVGNIGSSARMEYTAIGDTVNVASRLEGMTKTVHCSILASAETVRLAGDGVRTGTRHSLAVKGRHQEVEALDIQGLD